MYRRVLLFIVLFTELQRRCSAIFPCTTPNQDRGWCLEIRSCAVFMDAILSGRNDSYDFIRQSRCDVNSGQAQPLVCCGRHANYLNKTTTQSPSPSPSPPPPSPFPDDCGNQTMIFSSKRIVGGVEAVLGEFPWMARLRHLRRDGLFTYGCGGFLISTRFVLTAAHCIRSVGLQALGPVKQVQLGVRDTETDVDCSWPFEEECADPPQWINTADPVVHPNYSLVTHENDIAIIPLEEEAKLTNFVYPICLSKVQSRQPRMWVSGWGSTETEKSSPIKLKVMVPRVSHLYCSILYKTIGVTILPSHICAGGEEGHDACTGDSGGPLMVTEDRGFTWYAEGIISYGKGCGLKEWPAVYSSVPYYMPWIESVANSYLNKIR